MAKAKNPIKERLHNHEPALRVNGTFEDVIKASVSGIDLKKKGADKAPKKKEDKK